MYPKMLKLIINPQCPPALLECLKGKLTCKSFRKDSEVTLIYFTRCRVHPYQVPKICTAFVSEERNLTVLSHMTHSLPVSLLLKIRSSSSLFWHRVWGRWWSWRINPCVRGGGAEAGCTEEAIELQCSYNKGSQELWGEYCLCGCPPPGPDGCASTHWLHSATRCSSRKGATLGEVALGEKQAWNSWQL